MRLSDAIGLGRTIISPCDLGGQTSASRDARKEGGGCALDLAVVATSKGKNWHDAEYIWPWIKDRDPNSPSNSAGTKSYMWSIIRKYDTEVTEGLMTLDQLIDWVRSVEPNEPEISEVSELVQQEPEYATIT